MSTESLLLIAAVVLGIAYFEGRAWLRRRAAREKDYGV